MTFAFRRVNIRLEVSHKQKLNKVTGYTYYTSCTSKMVLHLRCSSVNHNVYLDYGFMATSEPQKYVINKISVFRYSKKCYWYGPIPYSTTNTSIPPNSNFNNKLPFQGRRNRFGKSGYGLTTFW